MTPMPYVELCGRRARRLQMPLSRKIMRGDGLQSFCRRSVSLRSRTVYVIDYRHCPVGILHKFIILLFNEIAA